MHRGGPFYSHAMRGATRACARRERGDGSSRRRADVSSRGAEHSEGSNGCREGTRGVGILSVRRRRGGELDRE
jgi:hypothetical protein